MQEHNASEKDCTWTPATHSCKSGKYVGSVIQDSAITCDEIIEATKAVQTKTTSRKTVPSKTVPAKSTSTNFYILLALLLITIALLIAVNIYLYRRKHSSKK